MKPSAHHSHAFITQAGTIARDCLAPEQRGKVLAVFSKTIYLLTNTDELFWIATDDSPMHRRCAQTSSPLPGPLAGLSFQATDHQLIIDPDLVFETDAARLWNAPQVDLDPVVGLRKLSARAYSFFSNLDPSQARGFGVFIPHILSLSQIETFKPTAEYTDPILRFSQPLVLDIARACIYRRPSRLPYLAGKLTGLGAGLTPSGDDFLGGLLFAVNHLHAVYPDAGFAEYAIPTDLYRSRTHLISFTLLQDHASGHAIAPLHHLLNGFISGASLESMRPYVSQLTQIGHSTGWDLLTGLLTALLAANDPQAGR